MPFRTARSRILVAALAAATAGGGLAAPALAAPAGGGGTQSVTVFLSAPHPAALARLASAHGLSRAQRLERLQHLVPSAASRAKVASTLTRQGFAVTPGTTWSVTASAPAGTVSRLFGSRPTLASGADLAAAAGALPRVPTALRGLVSGVFPTTDGPAPFHNLATGALAGPDFRNADTPASVTPSSGGNDAGLTVATLQLADFYHGLGTTGADADATAADLTSYATEHGLTDPVASGRYQPVIVDGGPSTTDDASGGDVEVDLDQQSILSTAPSANQHAYFAPNTDAGFADGIAAVYDDVTGNATATAPDPGITALSISWGQCESGWGATAIDTTETVIESLVAAGVTVFASSGDGGIYDCGGALGLGLKHSADVDFPASSPYVVAVGGTNLSADTSAPNTGSNWTESAWSCTTPMSCTSSITGTGGSGGGASGTAYSSTTTDSFAGFPAPVYQRTGIDDAPFAGAATRLVPDIAADGDPGTGFVLYTSNPQYVLLGGGSHDVQVGGTSLASPISAAQLTNTLGDAGRTAGAGDIHSALYGAYRATESLPANDPTKVFRDVTVGSNGADADKGTDPSVSAQAGYDTTTGLGGVLWSALLPYLAGGAHTKPTVTVSLTDRAVHNKRVPLRTQAKWTVTQGSDPSNIAGVSVSIEHVGNGPVFGDYTATGSHYFAALPGATYRLTVTASDLGGGVTTKSATIRTPYDDKRFTLSGTGKKGWHRDDAKTDVAGSHLITDVTGATATRKGTGRAYFLRVHTGPALGRLGVTVDGTKARTVDEYSAKPGVELVRIYRSAKRGTHLLTLTALGTKAKASKGTAVTFDALYITY